MVVAKETVVLIMTVIIESKVDEADGASAATPPADMIYPPTASMAALPIPKIFFNIFLFLFIKEVRATLPDLFFINQRPYKIKAYR